MDVIIFSLLLFAVWSFDWLESMPVELQQMNAGVEHQVNIVINNLLYDRTAVASMLAWLKDD